MSKGKLIVICQSGGQFATNSDGSLSYTGGEAHAIDADHETKFGDFKSELAEIWKCDANTISIKYLLPSNKRTLITVSNEKDLHRMINFHADLETADVYVLIGESVARDVPNMLVARDVPNTFVAHDVPSMLASRTSMTSISEPVARDVLNTFVAHDVPSTLASRTSMTSVSEPVARDVPNTFVAHDVPSTLTSRTSMTTVSEPVAPIVSPMPAIDDGGRQKRRTIVWENHITGVGQQFNSRQELRDALRKYAIAHCFVFKYIKNSGKRVTAKCNAKGCPWRIHASKVSKTEIFRVKTYNKLHTCEGGVGASGHPQASQKLVADIVKNKLQGNPLYKPRDIVNDLRRDYGIELSYSKAWRAKEVAREHVQGSYAEAYNQLPWYCEKIMETNPGSIAVVATFDDLRFHSLFVSFYALRHGFEHGCRPLIFLDGIYLGSKSKGTLLVAAAVDGDDGIFPLAYAVVDVETDDNWRWFMVQLRSVVSRDRIITFVFDRYRGVKESLSEVFENSHQAYCLRHLTEDFKKELKESLSLETTRAMASDIYGAARAPLLEDFKSYLEKIKSISQEAFDWVVQSKPEHWANAFFRGERYNHLTPNIEELFNNWILERPDLPILQMVDEIRCKIMELINKRREDSNRWLTRLTPSMEEKLQIDILASRCLGVVFSSGTKFEVRDQFINSVDIESWECSCKLWQISGMPCLHAIAVFDRIGRSAYDYCRRYFTSECYHLTYSESIHPVPNVERPVKRDSSQVIVQVLPPSTRRSPGRPRRKRIRSRDIVRPLHCSRCKEAGHNRSTCKASIG